MSSPDRSGRRSGLSNREAGVAVIVALAVGVLASLALRTPTRIAESGARPGASAQHWRLPVAFGTNLPGLGDNALYVAEQVARVSGGAFTLEVFEPGELVPAFGITEAVRDGKIEAGYTWLGYDQGKLPWSTLFGAVPFGMEPWEYSAWWFDGGGRELAQELYAEWGVHVLLCGMIGPETAGWFREPIESLDELDGLKIRFAGLGGMVIQRAGASVTMLPGGEIFQALEKGAIDATEYSLPAVDQRLGFGRVAGFNYFPGWHQPFTAAHLVVDPQRWRELSPMRRATIETACTAGVTRNLARAEALQGPVLQELRGEGIEVRTLPDPILRELARITGEILEEQSRADPTFARVLAAQQDFSRSYDGWKTVGYLPRDF